MQTAFNVNKKTRSMPESLPISPAGQVDVDVEN